MRKLFSVVCVILLILMVNPAFSAASTKVYTIWKDVKELSTEDLNFLYDMIETELLLRDKGIIGEPSLGNEVLEGIASEKSLSGVNYDYSDSPISKLYSLSSPDVSVNIPGEYYTFWRGMPTDYYSFMTDSLNTQWNELFETHPEILFDAIKENGKHIQILYMDSPIANLKDKSDSEMRRYIESFMMPQDVEENNFIDPKFQIVKTTLYNYILTVTEHDETEDERYFTSMMTFIDGKHIAVVMYSDNPINDEDIQAVKNISCSIVYNGLSQVFLNESEWIELDAEEFELRKYKQLEIATPYNYMVYDNATRGDDIFLRAREIELSQIQNLLMSLSAEIMLVNYNSDTSMYLVIAETDNDNDYLSEVKSELRKTVLPYMEQMFAKTHRVVWSDLIETPAISGGVKVNDLIWLKSVLIEQETGNKSIIYTTIIDGNQYSFIAETKNSIDELEINIDAILHNSRYMMKD